MSKPIRFVMIGGFLGAGKTTTIARLAEVYRNSGLKVGIVTNDQATDLVDTHSLRSQGFEVGEVPGSCFCCNFNALTATVGDLCASQRPDVILAEPVGSCTDLIATVVQPLLKLYGGEFDVAPYAVILKPSHGQKILGNVNAGFSEKAAYIFKKQIEEADVVLLNRIDELTPKQVEEISILLAKTHPNIPVLRLSAKEGVGIDSLVEFLDQRGKFGTRILDLDYDIYAEGEAELGWLNSRLHVAGNQPFWLDHLLLGIVQLLRESLASLSAETAHLKTIGFSGNSYGVANLVSSWSSPELSLPSRSSVQAADIIINARVGLDPEILSDLVLRAVNAACSERGLRVDFRQTQSFRPGRPVPTHRYPAESIA